MTSNDHSAADISVVIVNYRTPQETIACVDSLRKHAGQFTLQVIVVDNASGDDSVAQIRAAHPDITVIAAPDNGGFAYGNGVGFLHATAPLVLLLNPDAEIEAGTLAAAAEQLEASEKTGMVGASVAFPDGRMQSSVMRFPSLVTQAWSVGVPMGLQRSNPAFGDPRYASRDLTQPQDVDAVAGCFMLLRREVLDEVGPLDTRFFMYGEEVEWCRRIRQAGWNIRYAPDARIVHLGGASSSHMTVWKAREMMRGQLLYFRLAEGAGKARIAAALMVLRDLVRLAPAAIGALRGPVGRERLAALRARLALGVKSIFAPPSGQRISLPSGPGGIDA